MTVIELKQERWRTYGRQQRKIGEIRAIERLIKKTNWLRKTIRFNAITQLLDAELQLFLGDLEQINIDLDGIEEEIKSATS